jgi:integrase
MGSALMRRSPKYVHGFIDRHGKPRFYFRRAGFKMVRLPGLPWSPEFMEAYSTALGATPRIEIGTSRTKPGTIAAAVASYFSSIQFANLAENTRYVRRRTLERFRAEHGDKRVALMHREHLERMLLGMTPGAAIGFLIAIRALLRHAMAAGLRADDPSSGIRRPRTRSEGFYAWTEDDIAAFEMKHPIRTPARLAFALLLFTAQRRCDVIRMGPQHVRDGAVHIRQSKTGASLTIPVHSELQRVLDATPSDHLTFLVTRGDRPFAPGAFTKWFKKRCREAGLPKCASPHGLRKAACRRLAEAGCSASVIAAISGHATLREIARYTASADQARMARTGIAAITRTSSGKP